MSVVGRRWSFKPMNAALRNLVTSMTLHTQAHPRPCPRDVRPSRVQQIERLLDMDLRGRRQVLGSAGRNHVDVFQPSSATAEGRASSAVMEPASFPDSYLRIYADGSKIGGRAAAAAVVPSRAYACGVPLNPSVPKRSAVWLAELYGIVLGLEAAKVLATNAQRVVVFTDCLYLGSVFKTADLRDTHVHVATKRIAAALSALEQRGVVSSVCWVRGHDGLEGNEQAHAIARLAARRGASIRCGAGQSCLT